MVPSRKGSSFRQPLHGIHAIDDRHPLGHSITNDAKIGEVPRPILKPPPSIQREIGRDLFRIIENMAPILFFCEILER